MGTGKNNKGKQGRRYLHISFLMHTAQGNVLACFPGLSNIIFARDMLTRLGTCLKMEGISYSEKNNHVPKNMSALLKFALLQSAFPLFVESPCGLSVSRLCKVS